MEQGGGASSEAWEAESLIRLKMMEARGCRKVLFLFWHVPYRAKLGRYPSLLCSYSQKNLFSFFPSLCMGL